MSIFNAIACCICILFFNCKAGSAEASLAGCAQASMKLDSLAMVEKLGGLLVEQQ